MTLDYHHPATPMSSKFDLRNPIFPLALCAACAAFGMLSPTRTIRAEFSALLLLSLTCWYVIARIYVDKHVRTIWRPIFAVTAVVCVLLSAWMTQVDYGMPLYLDHWRVYGKIRREVFPLLACLLCFGILRAIAQMTHARLKGGGATPSGRR